MPAFGDRFAVCCCSHSSRKALPAASYRGSCEGQAVQRVRANLLLCGLLQVLWWALVSAMQSGCRKAPFWSDLPCYLGSMLVYVIQENMCFVSRNHSTFFDKHTGGCWMLNRMPVTEMTGPKFFLKKGEGVIRLQAVLTAQKTTSTDRGERTTFCCTSHD